MTMYVQVGWMPDKSLADELGITPLDDGYLTTIEEAERGGGLRPEYEARMLPVYVEVPVNAESPPA